MPTVNVARERNRTRTNKAFDTAILDAWTERLHAQFIAKGGQFYVCPVCFKDRSLDEAELVENAELKGATPLLEFAGDSAMTFNY